MYKCYINDPDNSESQPPPVLMLHGGAGTGKSTVLKAILNYADFKGISTIRSAFNTINALHINGDTTASLLHLSARDANELIGMQPTEIRDFAAKLASSLFIVVDELSN